jgi:hypothetical protein
MEEHTAPGQLGIVIGQDASIKSQPIDRGHHLSRSTSAAFASAADRVENRGFCRTLAMPVVSRYPGTLPAEDGT